MNSSEPIAKPEIPAAVATELGEHSVLDFHTHLFSPRFGTPQKGDPSGLLLFGIDELLTYHYVVAELFRVVPRLSPSTFFAMDKRAQADLVWKELFVERSPISESCRGVLTTLRVFGLETSPSSLNAARVFFAEQDTDRHVDRVMDLAKVSSITMTNEVFDDNERNRWLADPNVGKDPRFKNVLRLDPLVLSYPDAAKKLHAWGYRVDDEQSESSLAEVQRFLRDWIERMDPRYLAVSLPPEFTYPASPNDGIAKAGQVVLEKAILPVCRERDLPFAMMIGSRRGVNPALGQAGDASGKGDVSSVANLCRSFPQNRFFVTMLSLENQHELCVIARKFGNLMPFGCWWFLNTPSSIEHMTRLRVELLGTSFIPQHSDARVLEQLVYKWDHSRRVIAKVFAEKYVDLHDTGWAVTRAAIRSDVKRMFQDNYLGFLASGAAK